MISFVRAKPPGRAMNQPLGDPVTRLLDAVRQAKPVVALLGTDTQAVSAVVDECVARLGGGSIRVVRVRGLPGMPLTLSRIVEEIGADQNDGARGDDDELIVRVLATRSGGESQVVLILEQADLLPAPTLMFLQVALAVFGQRTPRLQLLFAGRPRFAYLIDQDELTPLRDRLDAVIRVSPPLVDPQPGLAMPQRMELSEAAAPRTAASFNRRKRAFAAVSALTLVAAVATLAQFWYGVGHPPTKLSRPVSSPAPAQVSPPAEARVLPRDVQPPPAPALPPQVQAVPQDAPSPAPLPPQAQSLPQDEVQPPALPPEALALPGDNTPSPAPLPPQAAEPGPTPPPPPSREPDIAAAPPSDRRALPSSEQLTRLRGEFDRFLSQTEWGSKRLSENERSRLFNEYLRWNYGALAATPDVPR